MTKSPENASAIAKDENIKKYKESLQKVIEEKNFEYQTWKGYQEEYHQVKKALTSLPSETSYDAMIPLGKMAFMPGKIVHTNEILVLLGDDWFTKRSASQAVEIVERRIKVVDEKMQAVKSQLEEFSNKEDLSGIITQDGQGLNEEGLPFVDIREECTDDQEKPPGPQDANPVEERVTERSAPSKVVLPRLPPVNEVDYSQLSEDDRKLLENLALYDSDDEEEEEEEEEEYEMIQSSAESSNTDDDEREGRRCRRGAPFQVVEKSSVREEPDYDHDLHLKEIHSRYNSMRKKMESSHLIPKEVETKSLIHEHVVVPSQKNSTLTCNNDSPNASVSNSTTPPTPIPTPPQQVPPRLSKFKMAQLAKKNSSGQ